MDIIFNHKYKPKVKQFCEKLLMLIVTLICLFTFKSFAFAETEEDFNYYFNKGKDFYLNKKYDSAIEMFEKILHRDIESANVYYNIAGCYFRKQEYGLSRFYYEKAKKIKPRDKDINQNISLITKLYLKDKVEEKKWWVLYVLDYIAGLFCAKTWIILNMILYIILGILIILFLTRRQRWDLKGSWQNIVKKLISYIGMIFVIMVLFGGYKIYNEYYYNYGVVITDEVNVKSGPSDEFENLFKIHEGIKIKILQKITGWSNIKLPNGLEGWIPVKNLKEI
jgi:tetratricopeptide (TPR) repeat protein